MEKELLAVVSSDESMPLNSTEMLNCAMLSRSFQCHFKPVLDIIEYEAENETFLLH